MHIFAHFRIDTHFVVRYFYVVKQKANQMPQIKIVEKKNHFAVHGHFDTKERAEAFLKNNIPVYVKNGFYMDKTLTADSFEIIEE